MDDIKRFLGIWHLVPDKSQYELGEPPKSGTYEILQDNQQLTFKMKWVDSKGDKHAMEYSERCDGNFHDYPVKEIADEICLSLKNDSLLESVAMKSDQVIMTAKRELISDTELKVTMSSPKPDGGTYDNVAWYLKQ